MLLKTAILYYVCLILIFIIKNYTFNEKTTI
jgi:hypothetical protein